MRRAFLQSLVHIVVLSCIFSCAMFAQDPVRVRLVTSLGEIQMDVYPAQAPRTAANFLKYVDGGFYNGGLFHRTVKLHPDNQPRNTIKIEVIQAGVDPRREAELFAPIPLERTSVTKLRHTNGVVSMARSEPDTGREQFFICIGNQPSLDYGGNRNPDRQGFAAFGKVIHGMDVVEKIQRAPAQEQRLTPPVVIRLAERVRPN